MILVPFEFPENQIENHEILIKIFLECHEIQKAFFSKTTDNCYKKPQCHMTWGGLDMFLDVCKDCDLLNSQARL